MINVTEKVTGMTFQGTQQEVDMWKGIMVQVNYPKTLEFAEVSLMRYAVNTIERALKNSSVTVLEDYAGEDTGKIFVEIEGKGYSLRIRRDEAYDRNDDEIQLTGNMVEYEKESEDKMINVGDYIETPRFCKVKIAEVYTDNNEALENGYTEPTHYRNEEYHIRGKHTGTNTMVFAAIKRF